MLYYRVIILLIISVSVCIPRNHQIFLNGLSLMSEQYDVWRLYRIEILFWNYKFWHRFITISQRSLCFNNKLRCFAVLITLFMLRNNYMLATCYIIQSWWHRTFTCYYTLIRYNCCVIYSTRNIKVSRRMFYFIASNLMFILFKNNL